MVQPCYVEYIPTYETDIRVGYTYSYICLGFQCYQNIHINITHFKLTNNCTSNVVSSNNNGLEVRVYSSFEVSYSYLSIQVSRVPTAPR